MLEDDFRDVLRKALVGRGMTPDSLAAAAGIKVGRIERLMRGDVDPGAAAAAGTALGLNPDACRKHSSYQPPEVSVAGVTRIELPFAGGSVNVWCIACDDVFVVFDAGFDADPCHEALHQVRPDPPQHVFVTHGHRDHISGATVFAEGGQPQIIARSNFASDLQERKGRQAPVKALLARTKRREGEGGGRREEGGLRGALHGVDISSCSRSRGLRRRTRECRHARGKKLGACGGERRQTGDEPG